MTHLKSSSAAELIAQYNNEPLESRARLAAMPDTPAKAEALRLAMADAHLYPTRECESARLAAIDRAELHRFVDALDATDLRAVKQLVAILLRHSRKASLFEYVNAISAAVLARLDEPARKGKPPIVK
jgi:hypothetical protein